MVKKSNVSSYTIRLKTKIYERNCISFTNMLRELKLTQKDFGSLQIIFDFKAETTFKMSFWADFGRESEKILTLE